MLVRRLKHIHHAAQLKDYWNALAGGVPFLQWEWIEAWWRHFQHRGDLYLLLVEDDDKRVIGIAPWYLEQSPLAGRIVRFLGAGEVCSDYQSLLTIPERRAEVANALAQWLVQASARGDDAEWDGILLEAVSPADSAIQNLIAGLQQRECQVHQRATVNCWRIPIQSWDQYLGHLSKPHRKHMRQAVQRLTDSQNFRVVVARDANSWQYTWERFVELHQRRRASLGEPGCFASTFFHAFLNDVALQFFHNGHLRLVVVEKQNQPIGSLLTFTGNGVAYAYQMGTNPDYMADSPGWLVVAASILAGIERGETAFDLLRGNESYKTRMGAEPVAMEDIRVISPQLGAKLRHTAWLTGVALKNWIKTGLNVAGIEP